jgi:hypothetical protein
VTNDDAPHAKPPDDLPHAGAPAQDGITADDLAAIEASLDVTELELAEAQAVLADDARRGLLDVEPGEALEAYLDLGAPAAAPRLKARCGARTKSTGLPCSKAAGWRTQHPGQGRCYLHGGATPIKHGRYSSIERPRLREIMDSLAESGDNPLDLLPEVLLLRALVLDYVERHDDLMDATLDWHNSFKEDGAGIGKPRQLPDIIAVGKLIADVSTVVDRIVKQQAKGTITLEALDRYLEQLGVETAAAAREVLGDGDTRTALLRAIEKRWGDVRFDYRGGPRA